MPFEVELDTPNRCVRSRIFGDVTDDELLVTSKRCGFFENVTIDGSWTQIADFDGTDDLASLTTDGVRRLVERNPWPLGCWRAIVTHNRLTFGLGRMYQLLGEEKGTFVGVVRTVAEAWDWVRQEKPEL